MPANLSSCCIVIIGAGRSGTSAMSGALQLAGVHLGNSLKGADRLNARGYFENALVLKLTDAIMRSLGSYTGDFAPLDAVDWMAAPEYVDQARAVLRAEFPGSSLFAIKDPRICRIWPIWAQALEAHGAGVRFLIPTRDPVEVTESLFSYGCSTNHGLMWWLSHTFDAERHSRTAPRVIVPYTDLLSDPQRTMERIAAELGLAWPRPADQLERSLNEFVDGHLYHRSGDSPVIRQEADSRILSLAESVYNEMLAEPDSARMDSARAEFAGIVKSCAGWRAPLV